LGNQCEDEVVLLDGQDDRLLFRLLMPLISTSCIGFRCHSDSIQTVATDGVSLFYNPAFVHTLNAAELAGVMTSYLDLPIGDGTPKFMTAVIEIPQGGINKYEYDKKLHVSVWTATFLLRCTIPDAMSSFPRPLLKTPKPLSPNRPIKHALFEFGTKWVREGGMCGNINSEKLFSAGN
jgi:hypothetical protein